MKQNPKTAWGIRREKGNYGERYEQNQVINSLPAIGQKVVVLEKDVLERTRGKEEVLVVYRPSYSHRDAFNVPFVYEVIGYTKGIKKPLDKTNAVILSHTCKGGYKITTYLKTLPIVTGSMMLCDVNDIELTSRYQKYNELIIAEYGEFKTKRLKKESDKTHEE